MTPVHAWPFRLSTVLSVTTGRLLADPADIASLLVHMTGDPTIRFDSSKARLVAPDCADALRHQFPALGHPSLPAMPATTDDDTVDRDRPDILDDWIDAIADILGYATLPDPWLPVNSLPTVDHG